MAASGKIGGGCTMEFRLKKHKDNKFLTGLDKEDDALIAMDGAPRRNPADKKEVTFTFPGPITPGAGNRVTVELGRNETITFDWK